MGVMGKTVCDKHEIAYEIEEGCPYCEDKEEPEEEYGLDLPFFDSEEDENELDPFLALFDKGYYK